MKSRLKTISPLKMMFLLTLTVCLACAEDMVLFSYDFEESDKIEDYRGLSFSGVDADIVACETKGQCLRAVNSTAGKFCSVKFEHSFVFSEDLQFSFDIKTELLKGERINYVAVGCHGDNGVSYFGKVAPVQGFNTVKFPFGQLRQTAGDKPHGKLRMNRIDIYTRSDDSAVVSMMVDNVKLERVIPTQESASNPPFFNWKPVGDAVLEYSQDPDFNENVTRVAVKYNFYTPMHILEKGKWYWRIEKDGSYGITNCIIIPDKVHEFAAPMIDEQKVLAKPRPRLASPEKLTDKERARLRKEYEKIREWEIPEDRPAYDSEKWEDTILYYSLVKRMEVMPTGKRLQRMAEIYNLLGDEDIQQELIRWLNEIVEWDPKGGSSTDTHGDIAAYHILRGLNHSYDALYDKLSDDKKRLLRDVIVERAADFEKLVGNPFPVGTRVEYNNHAWLQTLVLGESGLVLIGDYDKAYEWAEYSKQLLAGKYLCALGFQGENNEGLSYWAYGGKFMQEHASVIREVTGINLFEHPWLRNTTRFPLYCAPKNSWAVSFADSGSPNHFYRATRQAYDKAVASGAYPWESMPIEKNVIYFTGKLAEECSDPYGMWYARKYDQLECKPKPPVDIDQSVHYEHIGWAILNSNLVDSNDGVTFAMHSGKYWAAHQHADQNSFVINAYGGKLAIDSGYYDYYGSPHFKQYAVQTEAHNAILVDGQGQAYRKAGADGKITEYFDTPVYGIVTGDASDEDIYDLNLKEWIRTAIFIKPGFILIHDELESDKPRTFEWLMHTAADIEIDDKEDTFAFEFADAALQGKFILPEDAQVQVKYGYPILPKGLEDSPIKPENVVDEWTLNVKPKTEKSRERFVSIMQIDRAGRLRSVPSAKIIKNADNLIIYEIKEDKGRHLVCLNYTDKGASCNGIESDARISVLSFGKKGMLQKYMAYEGSFLKYEDELLFETDKGDISLTCRDYDNYGKVYDIESSLAQSVSLSTGIPGEQRNVILEKGKNLTTLGGTPSDMLAREIEPINFYKEAALEGYRTRSENDNNYYWWGCFDCEGGEYKLDISSCDSMNIYIDDYKLTDVDSFDLEEGTHFIQIGAACRLEQIELIKKTVN